MRRGGISPSRLGIGHNQFDAGEGAVRLRTQLRLQTRSKSQQLFVGDSDHTRASVGESGPMVIRHGDKTERPSWKYPDDVEGFLAVIGGNVSKRREAAMLVDIFMHGYDAHLMPVKLRQALIRRGLLDPRARYR